MYTSLYTTAFIRYSCKTVIVQWRGCITSKREICRSSYANFNKAEYLRDANMGEMTSQSESSMRHLLEMHSDLINKSCWVQYMTGNSQGNENLGFVLMIQEMAVRIGCGSHQAYTAILLCNIILSSICKNGIFLRKAKVENFSQQRLVEIISILLICSKAQYCIW